MRYSTDVKDTALKKILGPGGRSVTTVCAERGLNVRTVYGWIRAAQNGQMGKKSGSKPNNAEKFSLVLEMKGLSEEQLGHWLREKGYHVDQLKRWEQEIRTSLEHPADDTRRKNERELKELQKELRRKEKALAEMAALVVLKKKLEAMFGDEEPLI